MPDITMCFGKDCPLKESCYRFKAMANVYGQAYFGKTPYKNSKCDYYWEEKK